MQIFTARSANTIFTFFNIHPPEKLHAVRLANYNFT